nr:hypothetical protein BaRGS_033249 [Batillaria attramentaria]
MCTLGALVFLNACNTRLGPAIQTVSAACKVSALIVIVIIGLVFLCREGGTDNLQDMFSPQDLTAAGLTLAVYSCNYAYVGWDTLNLSVEEVKNPQRNIPLAILLAVAVAAVCYLLAIVAYHAVLTTPQIVSGVAVAALFMKVTVPPLMWVIVPCIAISAIGLVNTIVFSTTRIVFIGGRDRLFPEVLSMVSVARRTPLVSLILLGVVASVSVVTSDLASVLGAYSFFRGLSETAAILGIYRLRRKFPAMPNTYVLREHGFQGPHVNVGVKAVPNRANFWFAN